MTRTQTYAALVSEIEAELEQTRADLEHETHLRKRRYFYRPDLEQHESVEEERCRERLNELDEELNHALAAQDIYERYRPRIRTGGK